MEKVLYCLNVTKVIGIRAMILNAKRLSFIAKN